MTFQGEAMDEKQLVLEAIKPQAVLKAITQEAIDAIPEALQVQEFVIIRKYPFKVGRESRMKMVNGRLERIERVRNNDHEPSNNFYITDCGRPLNVSREHFQINKVDAGYELVDRGSACGTKVNTVNVGGKDAGGSITLKDGDTIAVGTRETPFVYKFITLS